VGNPSAIMQVDEKVFTVMEAELEGKGTFPQHKKAKGVATAAPTHPAVALARAVVALETALGENLQTEKRTREAWRSQ